MKDFKLYIGKCLLTPKKAIRETKKQKERHKTYRKQTANWHKSIEP